MLSRKSRIVKYLLFLFNLIFVITGIILISIGASVLTTYKEYDVFLESRYISAAEMIVVVGVIVLVVAFFGCCGAYKENYCMMMTFAGLLIVICLLELTAGIAGYVLKNEAGDMLEKTMLDNLKEAQKSEGAMKEWDDLQSELNCCGAKGPTDWYTNTSSTLPKSCCPKDGSDTPCDLDHVYKDNCIDKFGAYVKEYALSLGGVGIGIAFIQFLGIVLSCYLGRAIRSEYETV